MKALTIRQPFAYLILSGEKTIETRTWQTDYRGPLLIVSAQKIHDCAEINRGKYGIWDKKFFWGGIQKTYQFFDENPFGTMHCVVDLVDIRLSTEGDAESACVQQMQKYAWVLANVRPVNMNRCKGRLSLFHVPDSEIIIYEKIFYDTSSPAPAPEKEV